MRQLNANKILIGPSARSYIKENQFNEVGLQIEWLDYSNYPEYNQLFNSFAHEVSILDLIFNEGPNACIGATLDSKMNPFYGNKSSNFIIRGIRYFL